MPSLGTFNRDVPISLPLPTWNVDVLRDHLHRSLEHRILNIPEPPGDVANTNVRVAVLFSGGLDCSIIARMAHDLLPPNQEIDLINVAFENPRVVQAAQNQKNLRISKKGRESNLSARPKTLELPSSSEDTLHISPYEICPDRETGRKTFQELVRVCPGRTWRLVAVSLSCSLSKGLLTFPRLMFHILKR